MPYPTNYPTPVPAPPPDPRIGGSNPSDPNGNLPGFEDVSKAAVVVGFVQEGAEIATKNSSAVRAALSDGAKVVLENAGPVVVVAQVGIDGYGYQTNQITGQEFAKNTIATSVAVGAGLAFGPEAGILVDGAYQLNKVIPQAYHEETDEEMLTDQVGQGAFP